MCACVRACVCVGTGMFAKTNASQVEWDAAVPSSPDSASFSPFQPNPPPNPHSLGIGWSVECRKEQHGLWNEQEDLGADKVLQRGVSTGRVVTLFSSLTPPSVPLALLHLR